MVTVEIKYCSPCKYLPLALRQAELLLNEFGLKIKALKLVPGDHGVYDIKVGNRIIYSTKKEGRFPDYEAIQVAVSKLVR